MKDVHPTHTDQGAWANKGLKALPMSNRAQLVKHKQAIDVELITRFLCYITVTSI